MRSICHSADNAFDFAYSWRCAASYAKYGVAIREIGGACYDRRRVGVMLYQSALVLYRYLVEYA